ncbi:hypothetical protein A5643_09190 [Mycobacterium sp. 1274756.6]|nr:hypothetical protein A5643_09190 [Mycobacterium sp. 1274756.6]
MSRREFYDYFNGKEDCFLAAALDGGFLLHNTLTEAERTAEPGGELRAVIRSYLELCKNEPEFARCLLFEVLATGERGWALHAAAYEEVGALLYRVAAKPGRAVGTRSRRVRQRASLAAVGAVAEVTASYVGAGKYNQLGELEDDIVQVVERIFNK